LKEAEKEIAVEEKAIQLFFMLVKTSR